MLHADGSHDGREAATSSVSGSMRTAFARLFLLLSSRLVLVARAVGCLSSSCCPQSANTRQGTISNTKHTPVIQDDRPRSPSQCTHTVLLPQRSTPTTSNPYKQPKAKFYGMVVDLIALKTGARVKDCARHVAYARAQPRGMRFATRTSAFYWIEKPHTGWLDMASPLILLPITSLSLRSPWLWTGAVLRLPSRGDNA